MEKKSEFKFIPTISFDGVAIVIACVGCALWFGSLSETVRAHSASIQRQQLLIDSLSAIERVQAENLAVLQTLVTERTKHPQ